MEMDFSREKRVLQDYQQLLTLTLQLKEAVRQNDYDVLENLFSRRKEMMNKIDHLQKQINLSHLSHTFLHEKQLILKKIMAHDQQLKKLLEEKKNEASKQLKKIKQGKQLPKAYGPVPYQTDGIFFDKKK
ncbi:flagellar protein FliT [Microaerobacter geothermalis]|uniref:flagellar protein FliT n=1 Tax=Microaerobacter geothermalis TaxID=674972 RepID=UPI001F4613D3|nr:flagellar protein FliT [Microaerobacter geothermalis]MCF6093426.1 flagellar protein FliT [Microaerobacter geothermalis]